MEETKEEQSDIIIIQDPIDLLEQSESIQEEEE